MSGFPRQNKHRRAVNRRLFSSLFFATQLVGEAAMMYDDVDHHRWQRSLFGHTFSVSRSMAENCELESRKSVVQTFGNWLQTHEEAQVMIASILVVVGVWWLVRTVIALMINIMCPIIIVLVAVVCVPQLRAPLIGQNYPALAELLRNILLRLAENLKT